MAHWRPEGAADGNEDVNDNDNDNEMTRARQFLDAPPNFCRTKLTKRGHLRVTETIILNIIHMRTTQLTFAPHSELNLLSRVKASNIYFSTRANE